METKLKEKGGYLLIVKETTKLNDKVAYGSGFFLGIVKTRDEVAAALAAQLANDKDNVVYVFKEGVPFADCIGESNPEWVAERDEIVRLAREKVEEGRKAAAAEASKSEVERQLGELFEKDPAAFERVFLSRKLENLAPKKP